MLDRVAIPGEVPFGVLLMWPAVHLGQGFARLAVDEESNAGILQHPGGSDAADLIRDDRARCSQGGRGHGVNP
ncbi:hypothetical protein ACIBQ5_24925 [Streptomyces massasporeus]|uniref:hypothetical protein n=1 Tax=Streptomyces massasporeus TaxID=67324 RepID=UPI0037BA877B